MTRVIKAPTGTELSCKSWLTEAPLRMLMNNLDPQVAERPQDLVVYGGIGKAARNWESFDAIVATLKELDEDETMLVQSGKPVGVFSAGERQVDVGHGHGSIQKGLEITRAETRVNRNRLLISFDVYSL